LFFLIAGIFCTGSIQLVGIVAYMSLTSFSHQNVYGKFRPMVASKVIKKQAGKMRIC
jgi:hypothetical protein